MGDEIIKVGVSPKGGELVLGQGLPKFLTMVFPGWAAGVQIKNEAAQAIVARWKEGTPPTEDEVNWVVANVGESAARTLRQLQIVDRAAHALEGQKQLQPLRPIRAEVPASSEAPAAATANDWISKFWDDAGLVSDQMVQEIYARILVSEANNPGTCSLRTLRTLRYMDRATAEHFKTLLRGVVSSSWIPRNVSERFGIPYELILDLDDAGLVDSSGTISKTISDDPWFEQYGPWIIRAVGFKGSQVPVYVLTAAGRELARVAQVSRNIDDLLSIAQGLRGWGNREGVSWAPVPSSGEIVPVDSLSWQPVP